MRHRIRFESSGFADGAGQEKSRLLALTTDDRAGTVANAHTADSHFLRA